MKKLLLLCLLCGLIASCSKDNDYEGDDSVRIGEVTPVYLQYYIAGYIDAPWNIVTLENGVMRITPDEEDYKLYQPLENGENKQKFVELAKQKGDVSYNRDDYDPLYTTRVCAVNDYKEIRIVCLNQDLDAKHPRGTNLADIMKIYLKSYADYIRNEYSGESYKIICKNVNELTPDDLTLFCVYDTELYFDTTPEPGEYEMKITMVTTEGNEQTVTFSVTY